MRRELKVRRTKIYDFSDLKEKKEFDINKTVYPWKSFKIFNLLRYTYFSRKFIQKEK